MNYTSLSLIKQTVLVAILVFKMLLMASYASAVTWTNSLGGNWNVGTSWSLGGVPVPDDDVTIDLSYIFTISVVTNVTIKSLTMDGTGGTLSLNTGNFMINAKDMALVPEGCFEMGDTFGDSGPGSDELPVHQVCLSSFVIDKFEVTQAAYQSATGNTPSWFTGEDLPVDSVTWTEANEYCAQLGKRLPTEAEWEYAARSGGLAQRYAGTSDALDLGYYAWYNSNSGYVTHPVGQKLPNGLDLYDMSGNLWEWVADWYGAYGSDTQNDPQGPETGTYRVFRGGGWGVPAGYERASLRNKYFAEYGDSALGFRCARSN